MRNWQTISNNNYTNPQSARFNYLKANEINTDTMKIGDFVINNDLDVGGNLNVTGSCFSDKQFVVNNTSSSERDRLKIEDNEEGFLFYNEDGQLGRYAIDISNIIWDIESNGNATFNALDVGNDLLVDGDISCNNNLSANGNAIIANRTTSGHLRIRGTTANINTDGCWIDFNRLYPDELSAINGITSIINQRGSGEGAIVFGKSTNNNTRTLQMVIRDNGNVGIGTTTPTKKLDVSGNANIRGDLTLNSLGVNGGATIQNNLTVNGNVGIETTTPNQKLDVSGNINANGNITINNVNIATIGYNQTWIDYTGTRNQNVLYQNTRGRPILLSVSIEGNNSSSISKWAIQTSASNFNNIKIAATGYTQSNSDAFSFNAIIPSLWFYRVIQLSGPNSAGVVTNWVELSN